MANDSATVTLIAGSVGTFRPARRGVLTIASDGLRTFLSAPNPIGLRVDAIPIALEWGTTAENPITHPVPQREVVVAHLLLTFVVPTSRTKNPLDFWIIRDALSLRGVGIGVVVCPEADIPGFGATRSGLEGMCYRSG